MIRLLIFLQLLAISTITQAADWPEYRGPDRAGLWDAGGLPDSFAKQKPTRLWSTPVGAGYSGPTVAGDSVFVMDRGPSDTSAQVERIVCVDRATGKLRWAHEYECVYRDVGYAYGPRSSVTIRDGKAWALGTMGHLHCLDAKSGNVIWSHDLGNEFEIDMPIWGLTNSPLVEGDAVVMQIGAKENGACLIAFHKDTGEEIWRAFDDKASYVSPVMIEQAGQRVLVAWTGFRIAGMEAATGKVLWEIPTRPSKMPINVPGPALSEDGTKMFLSVFYDGSRLIELDQEKVAARELWHRQGTSERRTDALHSMISPPYIFKDHIYGIDSYGQMRCLEMTTGDRVWENLNAVTQGRWGTAFMVRNTSDDRTWMLNERGELVVARLTPEGYNEIDRIKIIEPTTELKQRTEGTVLWSHPAFAGTQIFARNDRELICVELAE